MHARQGCLVGCVRTEPSVGKGRRTHLTQQDVAYRYRTHRTHRTQGPGWESQDAGSRLGESGRNTTGSDAGHLFPDVRSISLTFP